MAPNAPSRAKVYFEEIRLPGNGANFLSQLHGSPTPTYESEFLEFKGAQSPDFRDHVLDIWAKNLSGFANSDGGVLIFGIDAPKGAAKSLSLVQDLTWLCEKLKNSLPKITEPPVQRVEITPYSFGPEPNKGFVVCYIPPSPWRPHQVRVDGQPGLFYIRASDNCVPCNHATLKALFAPQFVASMGILCQLDSCEHPIHGYTEVLLKFWLENSGPATANEVFVLCKNLDELRTSPEYDHRLWEEALTAHRGEALTCLRFVHPEERLPLFRIRCGQIDRTSGQFVGRLPFTCRFSVSVHDQAPTEFELEIAEKDLNNGMKKARLIEQS